MNKITLVIFICFLFITLSCRKQEQEIVPLTEKTGDVSLGEAQQWFDKELSGQMVDNPEARTSGKVKREPLWKFANNLRLPNSVNILSVPLQYEKGAGLGKGGLTKLVFFKDEKGQLQAQILKAISDMNYLTQRKGEIRIQDFSGILMMEDVQENFLNGVKYEKGKVVGELSMAESNKGAKISSICEEVRVEYYVDVCVNTYCSGMRFDYADVYYVCSGGGGNSGSISSGDVGEALGGGGNGSDTNYSDGGNGSGEGEGRATVVRAESDRIIFPGINDPFIDVKSFLDCFGTIQTNEFTYNLTIYIEEPVPGSGLSSSITGNVGHTCIGLTKTYKGNPASSITQIIGFYPVDGKKSLSLSPVESQMHNNGDGDPDRRTSFTISSTYEVGPDAFGAAIQAAEELSAQPYDLDDNNCTDYVLNIMNRAGVNVPQNQGEILVSAGHNPGQLGHDLRILKQTESNAYISLASGLTPVGKGRCN